MSDDATFKVAVSRYSLDRKIPQGDPFWPKFNASFENLELTDMRLMDAVHNGQAITTHHKDRWRTSENYILGQHLGLDMDTDDRRSSLEVLAAEPFIARYASVIYTTMSHTPEQPRARVVFLLDQPIMQPKNYTLAATALLWLFGTADRACKDSVRFWYGAPNCEMAYLGSVLPLEIVRHTILQYQETGRQEKQRQTTNYTAPADQATIQDALHHIPANGIDYDDWVKVLMGLHRELGDAALDLAECWAQGYNGEVARKFKSFKADGNVSGTVTIGTVFALAKQHGWQRQAA
jgi:hypothetical protein